MIRHFVTALGVLPLLLLWVFILIFLAEYILLFIRKNGLDAYRKIPVRFSNGDENEVILQLINRYSFPIRLTIVDEIPIQFQRRDIGFQTKMSPHSEQQYQYLLRPVKRGVYQFGTINSYVSCLLGLLQKRYKKETPADVAVYPS